MSLATISVFSTDMRKAFLSLAVLLLPILVLAAEFQLPEGEPITPNKISTFLNDTANFLIAAGVLGAIITIVTAGIMYFGHGFSASAVTKAKGIFWNALIGTLIILGVGVIINTVAALIHGSFFGP